MQPDSSMILFYPTSPVHVRDMRLVLDKLPTWTCKAVVYWPFASIAPGIAMALQQNGIECCELDREHDLEGHLPKGASILVLGAICGHFSLDLMVWAKTHDLAVVAIEEVAQLALNNLDINNYDAPFDRLFVASAIEKRHFLTLGYPAESLRVSGLLANDRFTPENFCKAEEALKCLGIAELNQPIVYTTSPIRSRRAIHNKDDVKFRQEMLKQIVQAAQRTGRDVIVKLHPNEEPERERERITQSIPNAIVIGREIGIDELFPVAGVIINRGNSQTGLEAVLRGVPTVIAACGLKTLFHDDSGALVVDNISQLAGSIEKALTSPVPETARIKAAHFYQPVEGVAHFIANELRAMAAQKWPADKNSWIWLIKSLLFTGCHDAARKLCERDDATDPWRRQVRSALTARAEGRMQGAIEAWIGCSALDPAWFFPHYELAHLFLDLESHTSAQYHASQAIALHPPFHSMWHEIPMRVVMMHTLRELGDVTAAAAALYALEQRDLLEIVPEVQIEAAAQELQNVKGLSIAESYLKKAIDLVNDRPINEEADRHILLRALSLYVKIAERYDDYASADRSLERIDELTPENSQLRTEIAQRACAAGQACERSRDYLRAARYFACARKLTAYDPWSAYRFAVLSLKQGHLRAAYRFASEAAELPNGPSEIFQRISTVSAAAKLQRYWPVSPRSILKPLKLGAVALAWLCQRLIRNRFHEYPEELVAILLVWLCIAGHFGRRLHAERTRLCASVRKIRASLTNGLSQQTLRNDPCPICVGRGSFEYQNNASLLLRCRTCNHVYACDLPSEKTLHNLYGDFSYWEKDRCHQGITTIADGPGWQTYLNARVGILEKLGLLENQPNQVKKVFEIGCAEGMLLRELGKRGMEVTGCEMNRAVATQGMAKLGIPILTQPFEDLDFSAQKFDLVMSFHTLEHMRFPVEVIARVSRMLCPEGAVIIEVPCSDNEYDNTDHLHFFSETSLRSLLELFFVESKIVPNTYMTSAGIRCGSIYGVGRHPRRSSESSLLASRSLIPNVQGSGSDLLEAQP